MGQIYSDEKRNVEFSDLRKTAGICTGTSGEIGEQGCSGARVEHGEQDTDSSER